MLPMTGLAMQGNRGKLDRQVTAFVVNNKHPPAHSPLEGLLLNHHKSL